MKPIEFLKKINTVLIFILLLGAVIFGGYLIFRGKALNSVNVSVDSLHLGDKK